MFLAFTYEEVVMAKVSVSSVKTAGGSRYVGRPALSQAVPAGGDPKEWARPIVLKPVRVGDYGTARK